MAAAIQKITGDMSLAQLGQAFAASGYFADARDAAQAIVKIAAGRELGFGAFASMTGIIIQKGKLSLGAHLMAAAVRRSERYDYIVVEHTEQKCAIEFTRDGTVVGTSTFTMDDAARAGLLRADSVWKHYPRNMLYSRAMSNGCKWYCPDVFNGPVYTPDELGLDVDGETLQVKDGQAVTPDEPASRAKQIEVKVYNIEPAQDAAGPASIPPAGPACLPASVAGENAAAAASQAPASLPALPVNSPSSSGLSRLMTMIETHQIGDDKVSLWLKHFNVSRLQDLADEQCQRICAKIESAVNQMKAGA
jgi:hypothetical protein